MGGRSGHDPRIPPNFRPPTNDIEREQLPDIMHNFDIESNNGDYYGYGQPNAAPTQMSICNVQLHDDDDI